MPHSAWMKRTLFAAFALLVVAAVVAGCGGGGSSSSSSSGEETESNETAGGGGEESSGGGSLKIALLLPENETPRYETNDKPSFEKAVEEQCSGC
jgi:D-xylose transport system substrate-binding protein